MAYTTDDLLTAVRRDYILPAGQWTDAQILAVGDEQLLEHLCPLLVKMNEAYFMESVDVELTRSVSRYPMPSHAMWGKIHMAHMVDSNGDIVQLNRIMAADLPLRYNSTAGTPVNFYLDTDGIVLNPAPDSTAEGDYMLRLWYYRRPNRMVATSAAAVVASLVASTGVITYTADKPATFVATSNHDVFSNVSPFRRVVTGMTATASASSTTHTFPGPRTLGYDACTAPFTVGMRVTGATSAAYGTIAARSSTTLTLIGVSGTFQDDEALTDTAGGAATANGTLTNALTNVDPVAAGHYVCLVDETVYPAVPIELHSHLKDLIGKSVSRTQGDAVAYKAAVEEIMARAREAIPMTMGNRVEAQPKMMSLFHSPFVRSAVGRRGMPSTRLP